MRLTHVAVLLAALTLAAPPAFARQPAPQPAPEEVPPACRTNDYAACEAAAAPGSGAWSWAQINLGTQAWGRRDFAEAVRRYDLAQPPGKSISSDAGFHAFRGDAYEHVGRTQEALADARTAADMLSGAWRSPAAGAPNPTDGVDRELVYALILPILKRGGDARFAPTLAAYRALPVNGWISLARRSAVMEALGDFEAAVADSRAALDLQPDHPGLLNNHCFFLARAGRAAEGLPFCERGVALAPDEPTLRHSLATGLAAAGRCREAEAQLAEARRLDPSSAEYKKPLACRPGA